MNRVAMAGCYLSFMNVFGDITGYTIPADRLDSQRRTVGIMGIV